MAQYKLVDLPNLLIERRKATISRWGLSKKLGVHPNQIQRDEYTSYKGAGFQRLLRVAEALGLEIELIVGDADENTRTDEYSTGYS
jgi:hypothetical protein